MVCSCCSDVPTVTIQLLITAAGLLYGQHILIPKSYKWTKRITFTIATIFSIILSCLGVFLLVLSINDNLRSKLFANFSIKSYQKSLLFDEYRCSILEKGNVSGKVMEFGAGPGTNFKCLQNLTSSPAALMISEYVAVEPNEHFHDVLLEEKEKRELNFPLEIVGLKGENIDIPHHGSGTFDVVISTHVLCSVDSPEIVLTNADRALKSGGRFIFFEHVVADKELSPFLWYVQQIASPFVFIMGNGCKFVNSEDVIKNYFKQDDRFHLDISHFDIAMPFSMKFFRPHIMGVATKIQVN